MKRTKAGAQPTRIMPKRRKGRENSVSGAVAGDSEAHPPVEDNRHKKTRKRVHAPSTGSEPQLEAEPSTSVSALDSTSGRRKRKKLDQGNSTASEFPPANDVSASNSDGENNRRSPELNCSICLGAVDNRAFTNACYHTFCFECLVEWSHIRAVCPLCKKSFHSIVHSFRSYDDYKLYRVPTTYASNSANASTPNNATSSNSERIRRLRSSRYLATVPPVLNDDDYMMTLRRRVYLNSDQMQLRGLWSSDGVVMSSPHQVSPAMFNHYPMMLERVRPWVLRDITVIIGSGDVVGITDIVVGLLRNFPITSEDFYERLFPYLGLHTRRFLQELDAFARSPFDMTTYDARVLYSTGANMETLLSSPTEHVEDISSSDDSDIEIVSPAVTPSSESAQNSTVGLNDHMGMVRAFNFFHSNLQTLQQHLFMSLPLMNRSSHHSGLESPVPGPSGLGQATVAEESGSVGSHATGSADGAEERSNSPLVLSDADSDIIVVDSDRPVRSPIHISSGEDDGLAQQARTRRRDRRQRRRIRRQRLRYRDRKVHGSQFEQSDNLPVTADCAVKNEGPKADDVSASRNLPECDADILMHSNEHGDNTSHVQDPSSSHSSTVNLNDSSLPTAVVTAYLRLEVGEPANTAKHQQHTHPKRSRSADNVDEVSVMSVVSNSDDVNPLPCKKHIRGHKSSKQKAKEVVAENSSADVVCDNAEKPLTASDKVETTAGSHLVSDTSHSEQMSTDVLGEVAASSVDDSSILCASSSRSSLLVSSSLDNETVEEKLSAETEIPVPSTSEMSSQPAASSSGSGSECTSTATVSCHNANECSPVAEEVADSPCARSSSLVQVHLLDAEENSSCVANDGADLDGRETGADLVVSSDCVQSESVDVTDSVGDPRREVRSGGADVSMSTCQSPSSDLPAPSNPCLTPQPTACASDTYCCISSALSTTSHLCMQSEKTCKQEHQDVDKTDNRPLEESDSNSSLRVVLQENGSALLANNSLGEDSQFKHTASNLCTDAAGSSNQSSLPSDDFRNILSELFSAACSSTDRRQSATSDLVVDENRASPVVSVVSESVVETRSPVGVDSSDSEVEWLETDKVDRRQRCISVSSGGSSVVCSLSDADDSDPVLSDSDDVEIFDDEPLTSRSGNQMDESRHLYETQSPTSSASSRPDGASSPLSDVTSSLDVDEAKPAVIFEPQTSQLDDPMEKSTDLYQICSSSPQNSALLPTSSDVASSVDLSEMEPAGFSERGSIEPQTSKLEHQTDETGHSYSYQIQPPSPQNGALLAPSSDAAVSVDANETDRAVTSEQVSQPRVNDAVLTTNTTAEYSDDTTLQCSPVANERMHNSDVCAAASISCIIQ